MFYYPNVLQRHTGCFATIWLAATGATKLVKREYLKVNVPETCEEIMDYILVKVPPPIPGAPQPRFSLYLSAQLQYGVVLVYNRQCQYLVDEIQHILERLSRARQQIRIDLTDLEQPGLLLPDQMALMETMEKAPDPFFGMMEPLLPSPIFIPHIRSILEAPTPERIGLSPPSPRKRRAAKGLPLTVSPDAITLREDEPITLLQIEGERDLPEITAQEIDLLVELEGFQVPGEERSPPMPLVSPRKRRAEEESAEEAREREILGPSTLSPPTRVEEEPSAARETGVLLTDKVQLPEEAPLQLGEVTPPRAQPPLLPSPPSPLASPRLERPIPLSPELQLPAYEPSPARPAKRRRQLRFSDAVTQISREDFRKQISDDATQCQPLEAVLLPSRRLRTPAELLATSTYGWMHLHHLWARCANLQPVDYARQRVAEEEAQRAEEAIQRAEVPSELEALRAAEEPSVPSIPQLGSSGVSLETTEEEPHPSLVDLEERILLEPEDAVLPMVPELPEISFELPVEKEAITLDYVRSPPSHPPTQDQIGNHSISGLGGVVNPAIQAQPDFPIPAGWLQPNSNKSEKLRLTSLCPSQPHERLPAVSSTCAWFLLLPSTCAWSRRSPLGRSSFNLVPVSIMASSSCPIMDHHQEGFWVDPNGRFQEEQISSFYAMEDLFVSGVWRRSSC